MDNIYKWLIGIGFVSFFAFVLSLSGSSSSGSGNGSSYFSNDTIYNNITNNFYNVTQNNTFYVNTTNNITVSDGWVNDSFSTNTSLNVVINSSLNFNNKWIDFIYQNGVQNYMFLGYNVLTTISSLTLSQSGRLGIQQPDNMIHDDSFYNSTGQNNFNVFGNYTGEFPKTFVFTIINSSLVGYTVSIDGGPLSSTYVSNWSISLLNNFIQEGLYFNFTNITVVNKSSYIFSVYPKVPHSTFSIYNPIFDYVFFYNVSNGFYLDRRYEASTTKYGMPTYNDSFPMLNTNNNSFLYIGRPIIFRSFALVFSTLGVNANASIWYCNGTNTYNLLSNINNSFVDGTINYTRTGTISYDISTFNWSNSCIVNGVSGQYWMILNSTRNITTQPNLYSITPIGLNRFEVYDSGGDILPSVYYDADLDNFNFTKNRIYSSGITNTGTFITPSITSSGSCGCTGVAAGGALSGATTGAFSSASTFGGTITQSVASTLNGLALYGLQLKSATTSTGAIPVQGSTLLSFVTNIWNGTTATNQEFNFGTIGDNISKTTTLVLFNKDANNDNDTILTITHSINISQPDTKLNFTGNIQANNFTSADGTLGYTGTCTILGLTNFVVKNGLIVGCT
jgi:hypothetical protein